jgi:murein DD-endopeptidase MepM/ murein hydrolase activator NlpD
MPKEIKTKTAVKDIKVLDKSAAASVHMKNAFVKSKEKAEQTQDSGYDRPETYATDQVSSGARDTAGYAAHNLKNPYQKAKSNMTKARENISEVKRQTHSVKDAIRNPAADPPKKEMIRRAQESRRTSIRTRSAADKTIKTARQSETTIKQSANTVKATGKGTVKTARKSVKTAERTAKTTIKTSKQAAKTAQKSAQAAAKSAKVAAQASKAAARAAVQGAKIAVKVTVATVKAIIAALKALVSAIVAGGWIAVAIILIICLVAMILGSVFGVFFSGEDSGTGRTMPTVVTELTNEFYEKIEEIKADNPHDVADVDAMSINWQEVLSVYAVKVTTDPDNGMDVATVGDEKVEILRGILNDMVSLSYSLVTETQEQTTTTTDEHGHEVEITETVEIVKLIITLEQKSAEDMASQYGFTAKQKKQLHELLSPDYQDLWAQLLGGYMPGSEEVQTPDGSHAPKDIFSWPLGAGHSITSNYGYRKDPITGATKYHGGVDIGAPNGTPILAAADGTVTVANGTDSYGGGWGYYVKIKHNGTYDTLYAHCSKIAVVKGQAVKKGQVIAYVGSTGRSTGNHLHFEVYKNGSRTNPLDYFI